MRRTPPAVPRVSAGTSSRAGAAATLGIAAATTVATLSLAAGKKSTTDAEGLGAAPEPSLSSPPPQVFLNVPYDATYTFVRVRFNGFRGRGFGRG
ncbi:MAG: hypothetical protein F4106_03875, partial [Gemmatimonadetes bacterium]|nr:hypothetical protein [Gemmatimonadota bacterium]